VCRSIRKTHRALHKTVSVLWRQLTERMRKAVSEAELERECLSELHNVSVSEVLGSSGFRLRSPKK
jgi:hypothetical protein